MAAEQSAVLQSRACRDLALRTERLEEKERPCRTYSGPALEKHLTCQQIANLWHTSVDTVRRAFRDEPGVLKIERPETLHKRGYMSLRIPISLLSGFIVSCPAEDQGRRTPAAQDFCTSDCKVDCCFVDHFA